VFWTYRTFSLSSDPKTWVLSIQGSVDFANVSELEESFNTLFAQGVYQIILDLEKLTFISSAGVGCLLGARENVLRHEGELVFAGTTTRISEIFDLLGIESFFRFAPDLGGALAQLE
jgi:anti-sigma B factor antagonist